MAGAPLQPTHVRAGRRPHCCVVDREHGMRYRSAASSESAQSPLFDELLHGRRGLMVASTGGHLAQMVRLRSRIGVRDGSPFVTFDVPQARCLLANERVEWVPYLAPRAYRAMAVAYPRALQILRRHEPDVVISTGAGVAVPYLMAARTLGIDSVYLESVSRIAGPSRSGRLLAALPGVRTFTQHPHLTGRTWHQGISALDEFAIGPPTPLPLPKDLRLFVTLGTIAPYRFDRLIDRVAAMLHAGWRVTWQVGCTRRTDLPGAVHESVSSAAFDQEVLAADVVISHAGVGSAIRVMELGKSPILVPRRAAHREHVDDHQQQIATHLAERGLCQTSEVASLGMEHLKGVYGRVVSPLTERGATA